MQPTSKDVRILRATLGLPRPKFAHLVGVDLRTVIRWELGETPPRGTAFTVMSAFERAIKQRPVTTKQLLREAAEIGGLAWLLIHLLERASL